MEERTSPFKDLPAEVRLLCVQQDIRAAISEVCTVWGLSGTEALLAVKAVLGAMCEAALESTAANLARALMPTPQSEDETEG